jgi:hypothetical protein
MQAPVWEHTAALAVGFQPKVKFAKVDCTDPKSEDLCMNQHIQAYPTIILFTSVGGVHTHEFYHGACVVRGGVLLRCLLGLCSRVRRQGVFVQRCPSPCVAVS